MSPASVHLRLHAAEAGSSRTASTSHDATSNLHRPESIPGQLKIFLGDRSQAGSLLSSATSGKSAVNSQDSTSLFELCLQHGAAEKRFRAVKPQTAACKSSASVSTLPDAAVIEFDSRLATRQGLSHSVRL